MTQVEVFAYRLIISLDSGRGFALGLIISLDSGRSIRMGLIISLDSGRSTVVNAKVEVHKIMYGK